jgi:hypothetical protein
MRVSPFVLSLILGALPASGAETTRVLRAELPAGSAAVAVENLAGTMRVVAGTGDHVVVEATVHADSAALAEAFRLERSSGGSTIHVRYPLDEVGSVRYPDPRRRHEGWWAALSFGDGTSCEYDGRRVRVSTRRGTLLYADVEIRLPASPIQAEFRNLIGFIDAGHAAGKLDFRVRSADLRLDHLTGDVRVEGSSGDIEASQIQGTWKSKFSSGDCRIDGFQGDAFDFESTSGDLRAYAIDAARFSSSATSGDIRVTDAKIGDFSADATSGNVVLEARAPRLTKVRVRTSSGDVSLRLPRESSFDANVSHGSGDVRVHFDGAAIEGSGGHTERYRRGSGGIQIEAHTGSGDLTISPGA